MLNALFSASSRGAPSVLSTLALASGLPHIIACTQSSWRFLHQSASTHAAAAEVTTGTTPAPPSSAAFARVEDPEMDLHHDEPSPSLNQLATASPSSSHEDTALPPHVLQDLRPPAQPYQVVPKLAQRPIATPALYTPWTPTRALQRRRHVAKRMGFLMHVLEREQVERMQAARPLPAFRAGDILEVRLLVPEAERKVAVYRGVCIARYDKGLRSSFKIYNVFPDCGGVVQHLPLYMPDLLGVRLVGRVPAKQERLYYLLERQGVDYTFQTNVTAAT